MRVVTYLFQKKTISDSQRDVLTHILSAPAPNVDAQKEAADRQRAVNAIMARFRNVASKSKSRKRLSDPSKTSNADGSMAATSSNNELKIGGDGAHTMRPRSASIVESVMPFSPMDTASNGKSVGMAQ